MMIIDFLEPWIAVGEHSDNLVKELRREVTEHHVMWNLPVRPIGQRRDSDDILFQIDGPVPSYAVVHLTWSGEPERDPQWPETRLYSSLAEWIKNGMLNDHREFIGSGEV